MEAERDQEGYAKESPAMPKSRAPALFTAILAAMLAVGCATVDYSDGDAFRDRAELADAMAWDLVDVFGEGGRTIAVYPFAAPDSKMGEGLAADLTISLANAAADEEDAALRIIDRRAVGVALEELAFQMGDLTDEASRRKAGRLLGADVVVSGSAEAEGGLLRIRFQATEVETGVVLGGGSFLLENQD